LVTSHVCAFGNSPYWRWWQSLIELIIVIVTAGIIAVTAAPRFIDISSDANIAKLKNLKGAIKSGVHLVRATAIIDDQHNNNFTYLDMDNNGANDLFVASGFPAVAGDCNIFLAGLPYWLHINLPTTFTDGEVSSDDWYGSVSTQTFDFMPADFNSITQDCYLRYTEPLVLGSAASISATLYTSGG
jgi:MSHA pilin protein MshA